MPSVRPEVDDLLLMATEDGMTFGHGNHSQMHERCKTAITEENVVVAHFGDHARGVGHVVRAHGCEDGALQKAGAGMKQSQHMGYGKTTTWLLAAGLAEVLLEFGFVGHGETGPVESPDAMAKPQACGLFVIVKTMADAIEEILEEGQWQAAASFAIGRRRKVLAGQMGECCTRDVAVKDLSEESIDGVDRIENAFAMNVIEVLANRPDYLWRKGFADILLETSDDFCDADGHPWPPWSVKES